VELLGSEGGPVVRVEGEGRIDPGAG
jgi:hypothetical protein